MPPKPSLTATNSALWPRTYILSIHEKAVEEGCCRVLGLDEARAKSLIAALYRIRRRGDSPHKLAFFKPEYHLVQFHWEADRGSLLCIYNKLPDGESLPELASVDASEEFAVSPLQGTVPDLAAEPGSDDFDIEQAIESMTASSKHNPLAGLD